MKRHASHAPATVVSSTRLPVIPRLLALAALTSAAASGAEVTFQYYRFTPTKSRDNGAAVQVSEFEFFFRGQKVDHSTIVATGGVTHPNPGDPESAQKMVDGELTTKWFDANKVPITFNFGSQKTIDAYRFATANDFLGRTPVQWRLEGSNDNVNFVMIDNREGGDNATPTSYLTFRPLLTTTPPAATGYPLFNSFSTTITPVDTSVADQTVNQAFPSIVKNGGTGTSFTWSIGNTPVSQSLLPGFPTVPADGTQAITDVPPNAITPYTLSATTATGTAALTHNIRSVPGGTASARYLRFTATRLRANVNLTQLGEVEFFNGATKLTVAGVTNPGGNTNNNVNETPDKTIDGNFRSKWLNHNNAPLVFDLGSEQVVDGYQLTTGNDGADRDPVSWVFEGSLDGTTWFLVDKVSNYTPPSQRFTKSGIIPIAGIPSFQWTGSASAEWDSTGTNWVTGGSATPVAYAAGSAVAFGEGPTNRDIFLTEPFEPDTITVNNLDTSAPYVISGEPIGGVADLYKRGSGELQLLTPNRFSGAILLSGGKLVAGDMFALGTRDARSRFEISNGAELHVTSTVVTERRLRTGATGGTIRVDDGFTFVKYGPADLVGTLTKTGGGILQFNGYNGSTSYATEDILVREGTVEFTGATGFFNSRPWGGTGQDDLKITVEAAGSVRMGVDSALGGDYLAYQSSMSQIRLLGGSLEFTSGFNYIHNGTVGGEGRIVMQGGTITGSGQLEPGANTGNTATTLFTVLASENSSSITGAGALALNPNDTSLTVDVADGPAVDDLIISRSIVGGRPFTKNGPGNMNLSGSGAYTGTLTVTAGTLTLSNFSGLATGNGTIVMDPGTLLQGTGFTGGTANIAGTVDPGDEFLPTATLTLGNTTLTGTLNIDVSFVDADKLVVEGTANVSAATLNVTGNLTESFYQIVSSTGGITGPFAVENVPAGYTVAYSPNSIVLLSASATAYEQWAANLVNPALDFDGDGDGLPNVLEFLLNGDPAVASTAPLPKGSTNAAGDLVFTFVRRASASTLGAVIEYSTDLSDGSWTTFTGASVQTNTPSDGLETVTATLPASLAGPEGRIFARLRVDTF